MSAFGDFAIGATDSLTKDMDENQKSKRELKAFSARQGIIQKLEADKRKRAVAKTVQDVDEQGNPVIQMLNADGEIIGSRPMLNAERIQWERAEAAAERQATVDQETFEGRATPEEMRAERQGKRDQQSALIGMYGGQEAQARATAAATRDRMNNPDKYRNPSGGGGGAGATRPEPIQAAIREYASSLPQEMLDAPDPNTGLTLRLKLQTIAREATVDPAAASAELSVLIAEQRGYQPAQPKFVNPEE